MLKKLKLNSSMKTYKTFYQFSSVQSLSRVRLFAPKKDILFIIGDRNTKVGSEETPGVTGTFLLVVQNEAGQRLIRVLLRECTGHSEHPFPTTQEKALHMVITRWPTPKSG